MVRTTGPYRRAGDGMTCARRTVMTASCTGWSSGWSRFDAQKPNRIIGRGVFNQSVVVNQTDSTQMFTMTWLHRWSGKPTDVGGLFLGLGVCCESVWCPEQCEGHSGEISI